MDTNFTQIGQLYHFLEHFICFFLTKDEQKVEHKTIFKTGIYMHLRN